MSNAAAKPAETPSPSVPIWSVALLLLAALLIRGAVLWAWFDRLSADPDGYRDIAEALCYSGIYGRYSEDAQWYRENGFLGANAEPNPTAFRPPFYPFVLSKVTMETRVSNLAVALLHLGLGVATVWVTWLLGHWMKLGWGSLVAAGLVAIDPVLLHQSALVMTETLATFLAAVALLCWWRYGDQPSLWRAGLFGASLALAMLCRPTFGAMIGISAIAVAWRGETWGQRIGYLATFVVGAAMVLAPWATRNWLVMGRPIFGTTHGGYTVYLGNNKHFYDHLRSDPYRPFGLEENLRDWPSAFKKNRVAEDLRVRTIQVLARGFPRPSPNGQGVVYTIPSISEADGTVELELAADQAANELAWGAMIDRPGDFFLASVYRVSRLWGWLPLQTHAEESDAGLALRWSVAAYYACLFATIAFTLWRLGRDAFSSPWLGIVLLCSAFTLVHTFYWTDLRMRAPLMPGLALLAAQGGLFLWQWWSGADENRPAIVASDTAAAVD